MNDEHVRVLSSCDFTIAGMPYYKIHYDVKGDGPIFNFLFSILHARSSLKLPHSKV